MSRSEAEQQTSTEKLWAELSQLEGELVRDGSETAYDILVNRVYPLMRDQEKTIERQHETYQRLRKLYDDELDGNVQHIKEVERLQSELRDERASQATRGNFS